MGSSRFRCRRHAPPGNKISQRPGLDDKSHYRGGGVPSIGLYQGLSVRKLVKDEQGNESLAAHKFLEMGERVYASDREMKYDNIDFIYVDFPNEEGGAGVSKAYIAADSSAAVVTEGDIRIFSEPKLTALTKLRLDKPQIVAVSNEKFSGFIKISYVDRNDGTLRRDVYAQSHKAFFSYDENDVNAAIFIDKILREEDEEKKELYLRKLASIPSSFQDELDDILFPPQQEDSPQEEPSAE